MTTFIDFLCGDKIRALRNWTILKTRLCARRAYIDHDEGTVWWAHLGENIGSEQNGKHKRFDRPVLIVKNAGPTMVWIVPLTSKLPRLPWLLPLTTDKHGSVVLSQLRSISSKRLIRQMMIADVSEFERVKEAIRRMLT